MDEPHQTLSCDGSPNAIAFSCKDSGLDAGGGVAPTLSSMGHDASHPNAGGQVVVAGRNFLDEARFSLHILTEGPHDTANVRAADGGSSRSYLAFVQNQRDEVRTMPVAGALQSDAGMKQQTYVAGSEGAAWAVRRLTPRECERLQGFPDDWTLIDWRKGKAADGPRYKAIGNAMAVNVMRWLGERIDAVERATALDDAP